MLPAPELGARAGVAAALVGPPKPAGEAVSDRVATTVRIVGAPAALQPARPAARSELSAMPSR